MVRIRIFILLLLSALTGYGQCDSSQWQHIYHSYRLKVIEQCKTVIGIVDGVRQEKDGDYHIRLRLDSGQESLLNEKNISEQQGCLVIEIVCSCGVTQADAVIACEGFTNKVPVPSIGDHISVTGSYVYDSQHGWREIHPVNSITSYGQQEETNDVQQVKIFKGLPLNNNNITTYLCTGSSQVFHTNPNCTGLSRCTHTIIKSTIDSAVNYYHRRLCNICGK